jgi:hypothetical protein
VLRLELTWQEAAVGAACLAIAAVLARRSRAAAFIRESALVLGLFALWQFAGAFTVASKSGALQRARWIWHVERVLHLPNETRVQQLFLPHPILIQAFNLYYDVLHFPVLIGCMIWIFVWHRQSYRGLRTTLVVFTAACLLIQLIPVAPPRMLPGTGLVDTAMAYHQSVYGVHPGFDADQLSAMPSVHVGWAVLVAVTVITVTRSRWRWLSLLYPAATLLVVVVTANHFWLDAIVALAILGLVIAAQCGIRVLARRLRRAAAVPARLAPLPVPGDAIGGNGHPPVPAREALPAAPESESG